MVSWLQFRKALVPILTTLAGMVIFCRLTHPLNASSPMDFVPSGITTSVIDVSSMKASCSIESVSFGNCTMAAIANTGRTIIKATRKMHFTTFDILPIPPLSSTIYHYHSTLLTSSIFNCLILQTNQAINKFNHSPLTYSNRPPSEKRSAGRSNTASRISPR